VQLILMLLDLSSIQFATSTICCVRFVHSGSFINFRSLAGWFSIKKFLNQEGYSLFVTMACCPGLFSWESLMAVIQWLFSYELRPWAKLEKFRPKKEQSSAFLRPTW
jgi:hypothetical protein